MKRIRKTAAEIREEAYKLARWTLEEREETGDLEGVGVMRDLSASIRRIRLTKDRP